MPTNLTELENFLLKHELKIGDESGYRISPAPKFGILKYALLNYFETYVNSWGEEKKLSHFSIINDKYVQLNTAFGYEYILNCHLSIVLMQTFLEIYLINILDDIHPILSKGKMNRDFDIIHIAAWKFDDVKLREFTINFKEVLSRIGLLITHKDSIPQQLSLPPKFYFLSKHLKTIGIISDYRNAALHNGTGILKDFALDILWTNNIIPLICDILAVEEKMPMIERNNFCKKNVLQELKSIELDHDYEDINKHNEIVTKLNYICHLKELGRASLNNKLFMGEFGNVDFDKSMANNFNRPIQLQKEKEADALIGTGNYAKKFTCPCCGTQSLITFSFWKILKTGKTHPWKAKCLQCGYNIHHAIGEPKEHSIMNEDVFGSLD